MKRINQLNVETIGQNAHTEASDNFLGEGILPNFFKKFKDVESLCKAYNSLEAEFTKRCQRIKQLEGEIDVLQKSKDNDDNLKGIKDNDCIETNPCNNTNADLQKTVENGLIEPLIDKSSVNRECLQTLNYDKNLSDKDSLKENTDIKSTDIKGKEKELLLINDDSAQQVVDAASPLNLQNTSSEGEVLGEIMEFFVKYPKSVAYAKDFLALKSAGKVDRCALQNAYIEILQSKRNEDFLAEDRNKSDDIPQAVKDKIIKDYLLALKTEALKPLITAQNSLIPVIPPIKPKNLTEAKSLAEKIIKIK